MSTKFLGASLEEHFHTKVQERLTTAPKGQRPPFQVERYTSGASLHQLRQKTECLNKVLLKEVTRFSNRRNEFSQRWQTAAKKLRAVDESIMNFEHVYKEKLIEVNRLTELTAHQDQLRLIKTRDICRLLKEKTLLNRIKEENHERLDNYKIVEHFLSNVVQASRGEFKDAGQLVDRAKLLLSKRSEIMSRNEQAESQLRAQEKQIQHIQLIKNNEAILLNNYVFELTENLAHGQALYHRIEEEVAHVKTTAAARTMILGEIKMAIYNIYIQMCDPLKTTPRLKAMDTIKQLAAIRISMTEMGKMQTMIRFIIKKATEQAMAVKTERQRRLMVAALKVKKPMVTDVGRNRELFRVKPEGFIATTDETNETLHRLMKRQHRRH